MGADSRFIHSIHGLTGARTQATALGSQQLSKAYLTYLSEGGRISYSEEHFTATVLESSNVFPCRNNYLLSDLNNVYALVSVSSLE
jgi:hypothetical protein